MMLSKSNHEVKEILAGPPVKRYKTAALDALNQYDLPALALSPSQGPHIMKKTLHKKANITVGKQLVTNTQLNEHQVRTSNCTVTALQRFLFHLCTKSY